MPNNSPLSPSLQEIVAVLIDPPETFEKWLTALQWLPKNSGDVQGYCNRLATESFEVGLTEDVAVDLAHCALAHVKFPADLDYATMIVRSKYQTRLTGAKG